MAFNSNTSSPMTIRTSDMQDPPDEEDEEVRIVEEEEEHDKNEDLFVGEGVLSLQPLHLNNPILALYSSIEIPIVANSE